MHDAVSPTASSFSEPEVRVRQNSMVRRSVLITPGEQWVVCLNHPSRRIKYTVVAEAATFDSPALYSQKTKRG